MRFFHRKKKKQEADKHTKGQNGESQHGPATSAPPTGSALITPGISSATSLAQAPVTVVESISPALASQSSSTLAAITSPQQSPSLPAAASAITLPELASENSQAHNNDSLWEKAYNRLDLSLREKYEAVVDSTTKDEGGKLSADVRDDIQTSIQTMTDKGKERRESQRAKFTVAKKTLVLGDMLAGVVNCIKNVKPIIDEATKASSAASIAWVGVSLMLPLLTRPSEADAKNLEHISDISSTMSFYTAIEEHLVSKEPGKRASNSQQIKDKVEDLYAAILEYLCQSVLRFYKSRLKRIGGDLWQSEDWEKLYQNITEADSQLRETTTFMSMLIGNDERKVSLELASSLHNASLDLLAIARKQLELAEEDKRAADSEENLKLLHELYVADPEAEMQLLENRKDKILDEAFDWILETEEYKAFVSWEKEEKCRMLCVRGAAGTGKTMLVMGIVKQLSRPSSQKQDDPPVYHFFCQGTNPLFSTKTSVVKSLMWQLLKNECRLISHLKAKFGHMPKPWFSAVGEHESQFLMLCDTFKAMLQDPDLKQCYFVVDALDECSESVEMMAKITAFAATTDRVKWLISGRPDDTEGTDIARFRVEIDSQVLEAPVRKYIEHKLSSPSSTYAPEVLDEISKEIKANAKNTFLWVWFVFQELNSKHKNGRRRVYGDPLSVVRKFPSGLEAVYERIMHLIEKDDDSEHVDYCKHCLDAVYLAERPMTTREMAAILFISNEKMEDVILSCGSFLSIAQPSKIISFIHKSAKDYLSKNRFVKKPEGMWTHDDMLRQSLKALSTKRPGGYAALDTNMYKLDHFGLVDASERQGFESQEPLVSLGYAVSQLPAHLRKASADWRKTTSHVFTQKNLLDWVEASIFTGCRVWGSSEGKKRILGVMATPISIDQLALLRRSSIWGMPLQGHISSALFYHSERYVGKFSKMPIASILGENKTRYQHLKIVVETSKRFKQDWDAKWSKNQWHAHYRQDKTLDIQDLETGEITKSFRLDWLEAEHSLAVTQSTESGGDDDTLRYLSPGSVFLSQGQWFAASYSKTVAKVWNLDEKQCVAEHRLDGLSNVVFSALSSDGSIAWCDSSRQFITFRKSGDLVDTKLPAGDVLKRYEQIHVSSISPDKKWLASVFTSHLQVWNLDTFKKKTWQIHVHSKVVGISFSDDGQVLTLRLTDGWLHTFCHDDEDRQQDLLFPYTAASPEMSSIFYENGYRWVTVHGETFVCTPPRACIWPSKVGNRVVIDSDESVVTITCECPSCMEAFG